MLKTSRPLGWPIGPLVFLIGILFSGAEPTFLSLVQALLLTFPFCLFLYGINDIYDYESDKLNPRKGSIEGAKLKPEHHSLVRKASLVGAFSLWLGSLISLNPSNFFSITILLIISYFYSAPPLRLKDKPPLDSLSNGLIFLSVFAAGYSFGGPLLRIPLKIYLLAACISGVHSFSTIMDYSVDKRIGDRTFAVAFGKRAAAFFALLIFILTLAFANFPKPIEYYLVYCSLLFLITLVYPSEKLVSLFSKSLLIAFFVVALILIL